MTGGSSDRREYLPALTEHRVRRGTVKIDSMAGKFERLIEISVVATTSYSPLALVFHAMHRSSQFGFPVVAGGYAKVYDEKNGN